MNRSMLGKLKQSEKEQFGNRNGCCPVRSILQLVIKKRDKVIFSPKVKANKEALHRLSAFFIEECWRGFKENQIEKLLLLELQKIPPSHDTLVDYLEYLNLRSPAFAWAWIRARIESVVEGQLEILLPDLKEKYGAKWLEYEKLLRKLGHYWFRQSVHQHLRLGFHTAISVIVKFLGTAQFDIQNEKRELSEDYGKNLFDACKTFAAIDLEALLSADGLIWDSAAANSYLEYEIRDQNLFLPESLGGKMLDNLCRKFTHKEPQLGCPALKSRLVFVEFYWVVFRVMGGLRSGGRTE